MKTSIKTVLSIEWTSLPQDMKELVGDMNNFRNDIILPYCSEFTPFGDNETWKDNLTQEQLVDYWQDQVSQGNFKGTLSDFIVNNGLEFDKYLIDQQDNGAIDLTGVDAIQINICW